MIIEKIICQKELINQKREKDKKPTAFEKEWLPKEAGKF